MRSEMVRNGKANFVLSTLCLLIATLFAYGQRQLSGVIKIDGSVNRLLAH